MHALLIPPELVGNPLCPKTIQAGRDDGVIQMLFLYGSKLREPLEKKVNVRGANWFGSIFIGQRSGLISNLTVPVLVHPPSQASLLWELLELVRVGDKGNGSANADLIEKALRLEEFTGGEHWLGQLMFQR